MIPVSDAGLAIITAVAVLSVFLVGAAAIRRRGRDPAERLDKVESRLSAVEKTMMETVHDVRNVRASLQALPGSIEAVRRVEVKLAEVSGRMDGVTSAVTSTNRAVARIEEFLIKAAADVISARPGTGDGT